MPRIRVPLNEEIEDAQGRLFHCWVQGVPRTDGRLDVHLAFRLPDETNEYLSPRLESTQHNEESMIAWAKGLSRAHLEGALKVALQSREPSPAQPKTLDSLSVNQTEVEQMVLDTFAEESACSLPTKVLFGRDPRFSNADVTRALQHLEERDRLLVRFTWKGTDWVSLQPAKAVPKPQSLFGADGTFAPRIIAEHPHPVESNGRTYRVYVLGVERKDQTWAGWLQFRDGTTTLQTSEETSQPNLKALEYWSTGLEDVFLEGALSRATNVEDAAVKS